MKKQILLACALCACSWVDVSAVATNYALKLTPASTVDCGIMPRMGGATSYTLQFWMNPDSWTSGATLFTLGNAGVVRLGDEGTVFFSVNGTEAKVSSTEFGVGKWSQVTFICNEGAVKGFVNGTRRSAGNLAAMPEMTEAFVIGGGFSGRIDEVRLWNAALNSDFDYFTKNTLNRWTPQRDALVAYYKFDQTGCPGAAVDYTALWESGDDVRPYNNHGELKGGAEKVDATDNTSLPYLVNGAYTANERFFDRAIPADQYLLSNDLIILGIQSYSDGHLRMVTPNNHGVLEGGAAYLSEYEGRTGVLALDGTGKMVTPSETLVPSSGYTVEGWVYVDKWVEGAYIFRKETADGKQGFSLRLGSEDTHLLIARCNGNDYVQSKRGTNDPQLLPGVWSHIAVRPGAGGAVRNAFTFMVDDKGGNVNASLSASEIVNTPTGVDDVEAVIGEGFIGKMDEVAVWNRGLDLATVIEHSQDMMMPGIGKVVTSEIMMDGNAFWKFDDASNPGYSSISQDEWKAIMEQPYAGHDGYEVRISVKSHNGWQTTISSAARRQIFAADLAELSKGYDGVELDLEWMYGTQTTLGQLAEEIRKALPADKSLMISCHNVAYGFPKDKMQFCDGFTFQQYGPQSEHSKYSHFQSMCNNFVSYGFPKEKIIGSYATTTSEGYKNGSRVVPIRGVRNGFLDGDYEPKLEIDAAEQDGYTFYFDGPLQTYERARYIMDNNLGGIFYWDMGNDVPVEHKYNLAKWCSYGLNSNVEPKVTDVTFDHYAGIEGVAADRKSEGKSLKVTDNGNGHLTIEFDGGEAVAGVSFVGMGGGLALSADGADVDASALAPGVYVLTAVAADGSSRNIKYLKK